MVLAAVPLVALAGDSHAVRNRWAGVAIGAGAVTLGGLLLGALGVPVYAAAPAAPPPVVYAPPPPVVYYAPPPVVYAPAPVVVYQPWGPPGHWKKWHRGHWKHHGRGWNDD
jgi:hypothetical protein